MRNKEIEEQLLRELLRKLKGKSVYKTLQKLEKGKGEKDLVTLKGLSSLLTHVVIECENGNKEYSNLIPLLLDKLNEVGYGVLASIAKGE